jgi:hypothetical protein
LYFEATLLTRTITRNALHSRALQLLAEGWRGSRKRLLSLFLRDSRAVIRKFVLVVAALRPQPVRSPDSRISDDARFVEPLADNVRAARLNLKECARLAAALPGAA